MAETTAPLAETLHLSEAALALFRHHVERLGGAEVDDSNSEACRELEAAGLMLLSRPFTGPRAYRLTKMGWKLTDVLARMDANGPSPEESAAPHA